MIHTQKMPRVYDLRTRLARARVLIADRDARTASLVHSVLFAFGFQHIETATDMHDVLEMMRAKRYDLVITEWALASSSGLELVRVIRTHKKDSSSLVQRDVPIIMLTAKSDAMSVKRARDIGITEFLVKPFSARTLSNRLVQVIDNPREFIDAPNYTGPSRRRRDNPPPEGERRGQRGPQNQAPPNYVALPPNQELKKQLGPYVSAADVFSEQVIAEAQNDLVTKGSEYIEWVIEDIQQLKRAYAVLCNKPQSVEARETIVTLAYTIQSQAGMFGYVLGTEVGGLLIEYLERRPQLDQDKLTVVGKHIETLSVIFEHRIHDSKNAMGAELIDSLQKLTKKLG